MEEIETPDKDMGKQIILFEKYITLAETTMDACYRYSGYRFHGYELTKHLRQDCAFSVILTEDIRKTVALPQLLNVKEELLNTASLLEEYSILIMYESHEEYLNRSDNIYNQLLESITKTKERLLLIK